MNKNCGINLEKNSRGKQVLKNLRYINIVGRTALENAGEMTQVRRKLYLLEEYFHSIFDPG